MSNDHNYFDLFILVVTSTSYSPDRHKFKYSNGYAFRFKFTFSVARSDKTFVRLIEHDINWQLMLIKSMFMCLLVS